MMNELHPGPEFQRGVAEAYEERLRDRRRNALVKGEPLGVIVGYVLISRLPGT